MKMKIINNIIKVTSIALILGLVVMGCKESASIEIDPVVKDTAFTFTPTHGYPGTTITLTGKGVTDASGVAFGGILSDNVSGSGNSITAVVPVGAKTGKISIVKENGVVLSLNNFTVDDSPIPTIMSFDPTIAGSGDLITISGSLLDIVDSVYIGDLKAELQTGGSASSIQVLAPEGLQTGEFKLYYDYTTDYGVVQVGTSVSANELVLELPVIASINPDISALNIGDELTIEGTMMDEIDTVYFGDVGAITYSSISSTEFNVTVPTGATSGKIELVVKDGETESENDFHINLPTITSFTPAKGDEDPGNPRNFAVQGTNLSLVNEVYLGATLVTVTEQSNNILLFTTDGAASGVIELHTDNGVVTSDVPFLITGEFWVNDFDNVYTPDRFSHFQNNNLGSFASAEVDDGSGTNNCAEITMSGGVNNQSFYLFGNDPGDYDWMRLYTPEPEGVYLEFDMRITAIDDTCKQEDGTFQFKIFLMDARGWGASGEWSYGSNGPTSYVQTDGNWQHFRMHLDDFLSSTNGGLYTVGLPASGDLRPDAWPHPNSLRILTWVFGTPNESGEADNIVVGLDNIKFVIE